MRRNLQVLTWLFVFPLSSANALSLHAYYGSSFPQSIELNRPNAERKRLLYQVVAGAHVPHKGAPDDILAQCSPQTPTCFQHTPLTYDEARSEVFGNLDLKQVQGQWAIRCVYCERWFMAADFGQRDGIGPGLIPDPMVLNIEHTWPQSRFSPRFPRAVQRSDLHILFPASARANSLRNNFPFGHVVLPERQTCARSRLGRIQATDARALAFEPPASHQGNVARAVFYFAIRYQLPVSDDEEATLRQWHAKDPVDAEEVQRMNEIFTTQRNRNPFVDHPELVPLIDNF